MKALALLVLVSPLAGFLFNVFLGRLLPRRVAGWVGAGSVGLGFIFAGLLVALFSHSAITGRPGQMTPAVIDRAGNVQSTGAALYTDFLLPVEVTSVLLLVAAVGAVYLALRRVK